jgi:hypothetical protein
MAQGSRFVAPRFNGPGLWDPRIPGQAYPEPQEGVPYVEGTAGLSGDCGCSGVGALPSPVNLGARASIRFPTSLLRAPNNIADLSRSLSNRSGAAQIARIGNPNLIGRGTYPSTAEGGMSTVKKVGLGIGGLVGIYVLYELMK